MIGESGFENITWFMGLVEDNNDPIAGRVKVRCFGFHPPFSDGLVDTADLPWAHVVRDSKFASVPDNGDLVIGFFMDGRDAQHPVIMGVINSAKYSLPTSNIPHLGTGAASNTANIGQAQNKSLTPQQRALLDAIALKESGGRYDIRYGGGAGGATFDLSTGQHPAIFVPIPGTSLKSSAAGRYQFTKTTWDDLTGNAPFTPENQDYWAWQNAENNFPGSLNDYLNTNGLDSNVLTALSGQWEAFQNPDNHQAIIDAYNNSLANQGASSNTTPEVENSYLAPSPDAVNNYGNNAMPPQMTGEGLQDTPALIQATARKTIQFSASSGGYTADEPGVPVSASTKTSVWSMRHGGSYIELAGKEADKEFINITHVSGSRVTLDANGNVTIKAFGKLHLSSEGVIEESSTSTKAAMHTGGYILDISGGNADITVDGNLNFSATGDINFGAGRKITMSSGDTIDVMGSKVAITAKTDAIDIMAAQKLALSSHGTGLSIASVDGLYLQSSGGAVSVKSKGAVGLAGETVGIQSSGVMKVKGSQIYLNSAGQEPPDVPDSLSAIGAAVPNPPNLGVATPTKPIPTPTDTSPAMLDESTGPR